MCMFSQPKQASMPAPAPTPAPAPAPLPADVAPMKTADSQRKQMQALRYGLASTIKTGPQGITGAGPDLSPASNMFPGMKTTVGS